MCGEKVGLILEDSASMDKRVKETLRVDFEVAEQNLVNEKLNELKGASEETITYTMKNFGIERFSTYIFVLLTLICSTFKFQLLPIKTPNCDEN